MRSDVIAGFFSEPRQHMQHAPCVSPLPSAQGRITLRGRASAAALRLVEVKERQGEYHRKPKSDLSGLACSGNT